MERALRNVKDVAATPSNQSSGYGEMNNQCLAEEVQKLNGYNHFSSSTASLLEEVVRRLVYSQGISASTGGNFGLYGTSRPIGNNEDDQPVSFGSTITLGDLKNADAVVTLDPRKHLKKSQFPKLVRDLEDKGFPTEDATRMVEKLKACYNVMEISKQARGLVDIAFYWLKNGALYWTWAGGTNSVVSEGNQGPSGKVNLIRSPGPRMGDPIL